MAKDNELIITAGLAIPETTEDISKDLKDVRDRLNANHALKIVCNIDLSKTTQRIQSQLNTISKDFGIKIGKIDLNASTNNVAKNFDAISDSAEKANEKIAETKKRLADLDSRYIEPIEIVNLVDAEAIISKLKKQLSELGAVTVTGKYINKIDGDNKSAESLNGLTATIKAVNGEVRTLNFLLDNTGTKFKYIGGSFSDKGSAALPQTIAKLRKELASFEQSHTSIQSGLVEPLQSAKDAIEALANGTGSIETAEKALNNLKAEAAAIGSSLKSTGSSFNIFDNAVNQSQNFDNIIKSLTADINNLTTASSKSQLTADIESASVKLIKLQELEAKTGRDKAWSNTYGELSALIRTIANDLEAAQKEEKAFSKDQTLINRIAKTSAALDVYANSNKKAISSTRLMSDGVTTFAEKWDELTSKIRSGNLSADEFKHLNEEIATFKQEVKAAGLDSGAFFRNMGDQIRLVVAQWISLNAVIGKTKDMISNVIDIDNAMVNLKKVTDETSQTYNQFADRAIAKAKELKVGYADLINQSAEWVKRGYDLNEAMELSTSSGIYSIVGEVDNATAVQHLTTVMKSYNMTVDESIDIVDKFNNISNKYSVNASDIGTMLTNSISSLSVAGNTLDQAIAMGTTISEITGDASEAGNTLKVLSMRLRGAKTEIENAGESTDGMAESTSKLRDQIKALTNVTGNGGFDIMLDENTFKSTYDIMKGISEVWNDINGTNQSALIELIAGKQRGNTVSALLTNMAQADDILQDSLNSAGSSFKEYENYLNSTEGKIQGFKTAFEDLSDTIISSDFLKTAIDFGTKLINVLDALIEKVGTLPTLMGAIAGGLSFKGVGKTKKPNMPNRALLQTKYA